MKVTISKKENFEKETFKKFVERQTEMMESAAKRLVVFVLIGGGLWCQAVGQKQAKKDHYYGAYIGDFQDRFHGVAGQVLEGLTR